MRKRIISVLLVACMLITSFVACSKKEKKSGENTLVVGLPMSADVTDFDNNALTKYVEEKLGIDLEFQLFSNTGSSYIQQISLTASAGEELPDVFWGLQEMPIITANELGEAGYFLDLTDLIDKYAPNYKAKYEELSKEQQERITKNGTSASGKFYSMPLMWTGDVSYDDLINKVHINQTWLDKLGLSMPKTLDEFCDVLKAFATQDPNGNGEADEIPMLGLDSQGNNILSYVINAYTYYNLSTPYNVTNGKLWAPFVTDEFRKAVIKLAEMRADGLLSDMTFTLASAAEYRQFYTPVDKVAKVGVINGHYLTYTDVSNPVFQEYVLMPALEDCTGRGGYDAVGSSFLLWCGYITKDCENPELAMKFLDLFYEDETITRVRHGEKGVTWDALEEPVTTEDGTTYYNKSLIADTTQSNVGSNANWGRNGLGFATEKNFSLLPVENSPTKKIEKSIKDVFKDLKQPEELARNLVYSDEVREERDEYGSLIKDYVNRSLCLFVSGKQDPTDDAQWNAYLKELDTIGLEKWLQMTQDAYDAQK